MVIASDWVGEFHPPNFFHFGAMKVYLRWVTFDLEIKLSIYALVA